MTYDCEDLTLAATQPSHIKPTSKGCAECLRSGDSWVHLRLCLACGHVGCCDDSKNRHATKHNRSTGHPVIHSLESGEAWGYCYPHDAFAEDLPLAGKGTPSALR